MMTILAIIFLQSSADTCSCAPRKYTWTLNLNGTCPEQIPLNEGLGLDSDCVISSLKPNTDGVPVKVTQVNLFEYGQDVGVLINYKEINGNWLNGDMIQVESIASNGIFPSGAGIDLKAVTDNNETIFMSWLADYTNACGADPYANVTQIAWLDFVRKNWMIFHC